MGYQIISSDKEHSYYMRQTLGKQTLPTQDLINLKGRLVLNNNSTDTCLGPCRYTYNILTGRQAT